jgi:alpha-1,6-mannosyltransferase
MHSRKIKQVAYGSMVLLYVTCICVSYTWAHRLYGNGKVVQDIHKAWLLEALPWLAACALAVALSRVQPFHRRRFQLGVPLVLSLVVTIWLIAQPLAYSLDVLRYMWDGRLLVHGVNPFQYVPIHPHLTQYRHWSYWWLMDWKDWPEAYPPVAQVYFGIIAWMTNGTLSQYKAMLIFNQVASMVLFYAVLVERKRGNTRGTEPYLPPRSGRVLRWIRHYIDEAHRLSDKDVQQFTLFLLFPPLLVESFGSGHVDMFAIPWLLLAWLFRLRNQPIAMGVALAMATCIKVYPAVMLAALIDLRTWKYSLKAFVSFLLSVVVVYLPFLSARGDLFAYFTKVSQIAYNGSLEYVLAKWFGPIIHKHASLIILGAELTAWYVVLVTSARKWSIEQKVCLTGLVFILASPVMHPWYVLPLLPFAIIAADFATEWLAVASHLTYGDVFLDMYIEYLPTYAFLFLQWRQWKSAVRTRRT